MSKRFYVVFWTLFLFVSSSIANQFTVLNTTFLRSKGQPVTETKKFYVRNTTTNYFLNIYNGPSPYLRCSSAKITLNGLTLFTTSDFNQQIELLEKPVSLLTENMFEVRLNGSPNGALKIIVYGIDNDAPSLDFGPFHNGDYINTLYPQITLKFSDTTSGIDTSTLKVLINGQERTFLFKKTDSSAICQIPPGFPINEGANTLSAQIADRAGNLKTTTITINVKTRPVADSISYEYQYITLDARNINLPDGKRPVYFWRQIKGAYVNIVQPDCPLSRILVRTVDTLWFELQTIDPMGNYPIQQDTVTVVVKKAGTTGDFLKVISINKSTADKMTNFAITTPGLDPSYNVTSDTVSLSGTSSLDMVGGTIYWTVESYEGINAGSYQLSNPEWDNLRIPIKIGDNFVTLVCTKDNGVTIAVDRVLLTRTNVAIDNFSAAPEYFIEDSAQNIAFTVLISGQATPPTVQLVENDGVRYMMHDDGVAPDAVASDNIYSAQIAITPKKDSIYQYRVAVIPSSGDTSFSTVYTFTTQPKYDGTAIHNVLVIDSIATANYFNLKQQYGPAYALDSTVRWLLSQPNIAMAGVGPGGMSLCWEFTNGVHAMISDAPEGTKGGGDRYTAIGLGPYKWFFQGSDEFASGNSYEVLQSKPDLFNVQNATVIEDPYLDVIPIDKWRNWGGSDIVVVSSHGNTFGYDSISQLRKEPTFDFGVNGYSKWSTPFVCVLTYIYADSVTQEFLKAEFTSSNNTYPRMIIYYDKYNQPRIALTPKFFSRYDKNMNGALLYMSSCRSLYPTTAFGSLWNAFKANGVRAMMGYSDYVSSGFAADMGRTIFKNLVRGDTIKHAYDSCIAFAQANWHVGFDDAGNEVPADERIPIMPGSAQFLVMGDRNLVFRKPGLVGYWNFEEGSGNVVHDVSGSGNDGVNYGASWVATPFGTGLNFNGMDNYVDITNNSNHSFDFGTGDFSVGTWICTVGGNGPGDAGRDEVIFKGDAYNSGFGLSVTQGRIACYVGNTARRGANPNNLIVNDNVWHYILGQRKSGMVYVYADGALQDSYPYSGTVTVSTDLIFGRHGIKNESYFLGTIDEVKIFNRALSESEITNVFKSKH